MPNKEISLLIILILASMTVAATFLASGVLFGSNTIFNEGNVNAIGVGIYWEDGCINNVSKIDWGYLAAGATHNVTIYIRNEGNVPMTMNMTSEEWNPSHASTYITVIWDYEGHVVDPYSVTEVVITLSVSQNVTNITSYSFDITIVGSQ
ncbi:MAG: hypothetical protein JSV51_02930 [Candidatus Bathyarchaeota archaeon]|nr:MAG: hypothetical protein JSV51_02930 [Candidatus Bathyarchaeota archaeon]